MGESKEHKTKGVPNTHNRDEWRRRCRLLKKLARESIVQVSGPNSTVVKK